MRRIIVSLLFALVLVCSAVGLKNIAIQATDGTPTVTTLAVGGAPLPPGPNGP